MGKGKLQCLKGVSDFKYNTIVRVEKGDGRVQCCWLLHCINVMLP